MSTKQQRIALIVVMLGVIVYTVFNYFRSDMNITYFASMLLLMGWLLVSQIWALIREWKEE